MAPFNQIRRGALRFWGWYQRNYLAVLVITTTVFLLQLFHLYWLLTDVVLPKATGKNYYAFSPFGTGISLLADYLEIPTLLSASLLYISALRKQFSVRNLLFLIMLNTQWAHILWITDEVVVDTFTQHSLLTWNATVAWIAILIDYLEVPVIVDTLRRVWLERHEIARRIGARTRGRAAPGVARNGALALPYAPVDLVGGRLDAAVDVDVAGEPDEARKVAGVVDEAA